MGSAVLTNASHTIVQQAAPSTNYDYIGNATIRKNISSNEVRWLLFFSRPFPLGATVTSAKLVLTSGAISTVGSVSIIAQRPKTGYSFSRVTWNTRPTTFFSGAPTSAKTGPIALGTVWEIDVTAAMQSVSLGDPWYGFDISTTTITAGAFYAPTTTIEAYKPRLEVTWSDAPDKPRSLAPGGGRAISGTKPIVRCDYVDVSGELEMQAIQVQSSTSTSFTSPAFDSGTVLTSTPELDLSTTAFTAMTDGQVVYWRARVQDAAGLWSDWADPVSFARDVKGTLTLNNPSSGTPTVQDSTPPIGWTFTGETQAAYQVAITETRTDGTVKTWTTGKVTSTANEVTPPAGVISSPASTYSVTLRIWDTKSRETIPGDPAYVEVVRAFTFVPSATVTATTATTAAGVYPYPRVALTWQRSTDPDTFTVLRNNVVIASGLIPNDIRNTGTTFAYTDRSAPPQTALTYTVQAVVNKVASSGNATASTTLISNGIWLADANRTNEVWIFDKTEQTMVYGEQSTPVEVVGGTEIVLVTQSLRGLEGTIKGTLVDTTGIGVTSTASAWRNKLLLIKAKAGQKCWLTMGDRNIQCVIRNLTVNPRPTSPLTFTVSFDFYQVGTLEFTPVL